MKSRFEVLNTPTERRNFAIVRSSGAVVIALSLLALGYLAPGSHAPRQVPIGQLLEMEIGVPVESRMTAAASADHVKTVVASRSTPSTEAFAFSSSYSVEPGAY